MSKTILYARVSTADQTLEHQRTQAEAAGFQIDEVIADHAVSGVSTKLKERAEGQRLFDKLRRGDVLVVRWVDRLGRNYQDVTDTIRYFMREGVTVRTVTNGFTFDGATNDPMQAAVRDALIGFMAAMAEAQAEVTAEAQRAGIEAARSDRNKYRGKRPYFDRQEFDAISDMLVNGMGATAIARQINAQRGPGSDPWLRDKELSRQAVLRVKSDPSAMDAALTRWGM